MEKSAVTEQDDNLQTNNIVIDDALLARKCADGDLASMEVLITKYQDRIYNVIFRICANAHDAAELTQDTFVKVIENIDKFKGKSGLYTWIFRIAVNLTINFCKRQVRVGFHSLQQEFNESSGDSVAMLKDFMADENEPDPADLAQKKELQELAFKALSLLDENYRAVIILRDIEAMSYDEIAQVLELELGTVKSRLSRAREALRKSLKAILK